MPLLWDDQFEGLTQFAPTIIEQLPTHFFTKPGYQRLGKVAESLFNDYIQTTPNFKVVLENYQVIDNKQTIGELDVVLKNEFDKTIYHVELVTKFYVYHPDYDPDSIDAWIGPNRNDSLKNKIEKLQNKQLPLLYHPITKSFLQSLGLTPEGIHQRVCYKAWLFVPLKFNSKLNLFNNQCIAGNYVTFDELMGLHNLKTTYFCPPKKDWLRFPETQKEWHLLTDCMPKIQEFMNGHQAIMIWIQYEEQYKRFIIVPYQQF
ncbi:DUF1853 family protein [Aquimarina agarivorans]|uniref:DUF1853 family protein n=1 Tax=Aquimarina agarivorans TaxID=980584 RepID=UPI000248FAC2|nr:DUF1853 family protein [Aquimarina agarivorans]